ncbi:NHL repeat-containing protein 2-like [Homarus americanus]|uniref:NHL repeat-containing protein 2-like n=1 Tax=Homarus americanus TaxID=6706 RepID=A0A8J5MU87_HOMAM|nr:NHL repeat-containing protein 2-like [Homarus americanus]
MEGPAQSIGELTLICLDLAARIEEATTREEKISIINEHIETYTLEKIPMVDFEAGLEWFNVFRPLTLAGDLKGRVSVLDFFTYCCINCIHILPDLKALEEQHPATNEEVGVHSAKFDNERPDASPLFVLVGEGHSDRLQLYVDTAVRYFSSSGRLSKTAVPLAPLKHYQATGSLLLYPGKVAVHPGGLIVSDSGHNKILLTDFEGSVTAISSPWDLCLGRSLDQAEDGPENLLLVAMAGTHQIWGVFLSNGKWLKGSSYSKGTVVRLAGSGAEENRNTSYPTRAGFAQPSGLTLGTHSGAAVLYIADSESSSVRKMNLTDGAVKAVVGGARDPLDLFAYGDVDGSGVEAKLQHPLAVAAVGDRIKVVRPSGKTYILTTVAGGQYTEKNKDEASDSKLNEPGGLCASVDGSCLYIADTNNHSIKVLSLTDHSIRQLPIRLVDESDSSSQDLLNSDAEVEEVVVEVPSGREVQVILRIKASLPEEASLNNDAPNKWTLDTSGSQVTVTSSEGKLQEETDVPITLQPISDAASDTKLKLLCVMFVCLNSGVCVTTQSKFEVRFRSIIESSQSAEEDEIIVNIPLQGKALPNYH